MNFDKGIIIKNKLDTITIKLNRLLEHHNELKHILNEDIIINEQILDEGLFFDIEKDIVETQLEVNLMIDNVINNI